MAWLNNSYIYTRRFPFYVLVDISSSKHTHVALHFLREMLRLLRTDPYALETCCLSIVLHNNRCILHKEILTSIADVNLDKFITMDFDEYAQYYVQQDRALFNELYHLVVRTEVIKTTKDIKGDWKPVIIHISNETIGFEFLWNNSSLTQSKFTTENNTANSICDITAIASYTSYIFNNLLHDDEIMNINEFIRYTQDNR